MDFLSSWGANEQRLRREISINAVMWQMIQFFDDGCTGESEWG